MSTDTTNSDRALEDETLQEGSSFPASAEPMLTRLEAIAQEVNVGNEIEEILERLVRAVVENTPWSQCWVGLIDLEQKVSVSQFHAGFDPVAALEFDQWPIDASPSLTAIRTERPLMLPDITLAAEFPHASKVAPSAGYRGVLFVPIRAGERWVVLQVSYEEVHSFSSAEQSFATVIASLVAIAFRNLLARKRELEAERTTNAQLSRLNEIVVRQNSMLKQLSEAHEELIHTQLRGERQEALAESISRLLHAPVIWVDRLFQVISCAQVAEHSAEAIAASLARPEFAGKRPDSRERPKRLEIDERELLVGSVTDGVETLGHLIALPETGVLDEVGDRLVELACTNLALNMLRQRAATEAELRLHSDFGEALLSRSPGGAALTQRARMMGIDVDAMNVVIRARIAGLRSPELSLRDSFELSGFVRKQLARARVVAAVSSSGLSEFVVVVPENALESNGMEAVARTLRGALQDGVRVLRLPCEAGATIQIGIGSSGTGAEGIRRSSLEARRALEVLDAQSQVDGTLAISEAGSYSLFTTTDENDRRAFIDRYLGRLLEYDRRNDTDLVDTLSTYFAMVGNVQKTAERLFLHISSVRYRLSRIEEIAEISLQDEEDRICLQLAIRLARTVDAAHSQT